MKVIEQIAVGSAPNSGGEHTLYALTQDGKVYFLSEAEDKWL